MRFQWNRPGAVATTAEPPCSNTKPDRTDPTLPPVRTGSYRKTDIRFITLKVWSKHEMNVKLSFFRMVIKYGVTKLAGEATLRSAGEFCSIWNKIYRNASKFDRISSLMAVLRFRMHRDRTNRFRPTAPPRFERQQHRTGLGKTLAACTSKDGTCRRKLSRGHAQIVATSERCKPELGPPERRSR